MMMAETTKVLLVEDNPGDARLIREMLAEAGGDGFELEWVSQLSEGLERLSAGKVGLVLLDLGLPDSRGIDTFSRAYAHAPEVPFVLITGLDDETLALTAISQGAQDYLVKGETNAKLLLRAIRYATERKRAELSLEAERKKLFSVLNSLPAFVHLRGPDFMIRFANRRFTEVFGEPGAKPCYEVLRGRSEPCEDCQALEVLRTKVPQKFEWTSPLNASTYEIYHYPFSVDNGLLVLTLGIDITERKRAEEQLLKKTHDLGERVKELHCLYNIARLMGMPNISLDEIIQRVLELIPPAWQYPDITCARITLEGRTFRSGNFRETQWRQASDILVHGDCLGRLEVYYGRKKPTLHEGPFLKEERNLLEAIAKALGVIIERKQAEKEISRLASFPQLNPNPVLEIDASRAITFCNQAAIAALENSGAAGPGDFLPEDLGEIQAAAREKGERVFYREVKIKDGVFGEHIHFAEPFNVLRIYARDITERKQAEQNLRESEHNLRYLASQLLTAQERERKRISRELHDSAAQELSALKIGLENLLADSPEKPVEEFSFRISQLLQQLQRILTSIRTLSYDLRPPDLEHFGLVQAIKTHCEEFTARTGIKVDFMAAGIEAGHLDDDAAINLYRIIQEGLTNVWRHTQAMNVNIRLIASFPKIILRLKDDGQGFDVMEQEESTAKDKRLGLLGMRERVTLLGGAMKIESQLNKGTKISIEIPWKGEDLGSKKETPHC